MLCLSGLLVVPFLTADVACAGSATTELRVQLIAATFVTSGLATIVQASLIPSVLTPPLQTTFGLRLSILHGPSFAFLPPLLAFKALPENYCSADENTLVPPEAWMFRMRTVRGDLPFCTVSRSKAVSSSVCSQWCSWVPRASLECLPNSSVRSPSLL